jgi:hypothetical protein
VVWCSVGEDDLEKRTIRVIRGLDLGCGIVSKCRQFIDLHSAGTMAVNARIHADKEHIPLLLVAVEHGLEDPEYTASGTAWPLPL